MIFLLISVNPDSQDAHSCPITNDSGTGEDFIPAFFRRWVKIFYAVLFTYYYTFLLVWLVHSPVPLILLISFLIILSCSIMLYSQRHQHPELYYTIPGQNYYFNLQYQVPV